MKGEWRTYLCVMNEFTNASGEAQGQNKPQGHSAQSNRISLPTFISDLPHAIFHVDRGIIFNFRQLMIQPAAMIHDYLGGNRKAYFHPATYLVISLIINYLVVKLTDLHFYDDGELATMSPLAAQAIRDYDALQWWFLEHTYIYILIAIPASTLFLYTIFRLSHQKLNVAETAVVILFTIGQGCLCKVLFICVLAG